MSRPNSMKYSLPLLFNFNIEDIKTEEDFLKVFGDNKEMYIFISTGEYVKIQYFEVKEDKIIFHYMPKKHFDKSYLINDIVFLDEKKYKAYIKLNDTMAQHNNTLIIPRFKDIADIFMPTWFMANKDLSSDDVNHYFNLSHIEPEYISVNSEEPTYLVCPPDYTREDCACDDIMIGIYFKDLNELKDKYDSLFANQNEGQLVPDGIC